jgi:hypothetical protein
MVCIDCHGSSALMSKDDTSKTTTCADCHLETLLEKGLPFRVTERNNNYTLLSATGELHTLPLARNRAHFLDTNRTEVKNISCQVCHARWSFNDFGKHFLRSDTDEFDPWVFLTKQGSSEIEWILTNNTDYDREELPPEMSDKITGQKKTGLWYTGYTMRRWQPVLLGRDKNGTLTTVRPVLDYFLSWIDEDEEVRYDGLPAESEHHGLLPYTPHTTGPAGIFYKNRIRTFLENENRKQ